MKVQSLCVSAVYSGMPSLFGSYEPSFGAITNTYIGKIIQLFMVKYLNYKQLIKFNYFPVLFFSIKLITIQKKACAFPMLSVSPASPLRVDSYVGESL